MRWRNVGFKISTIENLTVKKLRLIIHILSCYICIFFNIFTYLYENSSYASLSLLFHFVVQTPQQLFHHNVRCNINSPRVRRAQDLFINMEFHFWLNETNLYMFVYYVRNENIQSFEQALTEITKIGKIRKLRNGLYFFYYHTLLYKYSASRQTR